MKIETEKHGLNTHKTAEELGMPKHESTPFQQLRRGVLLLECRIVALEEEVEALKRGT
jgi:hypothetical protein